MFLCWSSLLWISYLLLWPRERQIFANLLYSPRSDLSVSLLVLEIADGPLATCFCLCAQNYCLHLILEGFLLLSAPVFKSFSYPFLLYLSCFPTHLKLKKKHSRAWEKMPTASELKKEKKKTSKVDRSVKNLKHKT